MGSIPFFTIARESFEKNSGYKSTAYALAEIIDNAAEEDAQNITIIVKENTTPRFLLAIGVLDDGNGMDPNTLQAAVCMRSGTHFDRLHSSGNGRRKFGKYGVGLPKASLSQSNRFAVWSWQNGCRRDAYQSIVDITDANWISSGCTIADPIVTPMPEDWFLASGHEESQSGTFVLWDDLDGHTWTTTRGLLPNLFFLIGRAYRKLLSVPDRTSENIKLKLTVVVCDENMNVKEIHPIKANDPLYLTSDTGVPEPSYNPNWIKGTPQFERTISDTLPIRVVHKDGTEKEYIIKITGSVSSAITRTVLNGRHPGNQPHGKHAVKNQGVSFLREGREVILDTRWCISDTRERWWGIEVDCPHELDDYLGVTNSKQSMDRLLNVYNLGHDDIAEEGESTQATLARLRSEDPKYASCVELSWAIKRHVSALRTLAQHTNGPSIRTNSISDLPGTEEFSVELPHESDPEGKAEDIASVVDANEGSSTTEVDAEWRLEAIRKHLRERNVPDTEITHVLERLVNRGLRYLIIRRGGLGSSMFSVDRVVDAKLITLNTDHPAFQSLLETLTSSENTVDLSKEDLLEQMKSAKTTMLLLLEAWAKMESEAQGEERAFLMRAREDWGRLLWKFVEEMNDRSVN